MIINSEYYIPTGWALGTINDIVGVDGVFIDGDWVESKDQDPKGDVRLIQLADIGDGFFRNKSNRFLTYDKAIELRCTFLKSGDVLVARMPEPLGRSCIFPGDSKRCVTVVDVCIIRTGESEANPKCLMYILNSPDVRNAIEKFQRGTTRKRISRSNLAKVSLPLPPLPEQHRIVSKVDELLAGVNSARERLARVPGILKRFRQSVLAAACSGRLTADWREKQTDLDPASRLIERIYAERLRRYGENSAESKSKKGRLTKTPTKPQICSLIDLPEVPDGWIWMTCDQLCQPERALTYGVIKLGPPVLNGIPTLRSSDVRNLFIDEGGIKRISPVIAAEYSRTFLEGGELVVTVRGTLGGVAVVPAHMKGYNVSREVAVIPIEPIFNPSFFACAIGSVWGKNWLKEVAKGVTYTGINIEDLKLLPLPVPPLSEQHEIVRRVEALFQLADAIEARVAAGAHRADRLTQAILAKAFRGELVPTEAELARRAGRDFEPAAVLLSRLQEERRLINEAQPRRQTRKGQKRQKA